MRISYVFPISCQVANIPPAVRRAELIQHSNFGNTQTRSSDLSFQSRRACLCLFSRIHADCPPIMKAHREFRIRTQKGTRNPRPKFQLNISPPAMLKTATVTRTVKRLYHVPRRYHVNVVEGLGAARCSVSRFRYVHRCSSNSITAHFSCTASETVPQRPQQNWRTTTTFASIRR